MSATRRNVQERDPSCSVPNIERHGYVVTKKHNQQKNLLAKVAAQFPFQDWFRKNFLPTGLVSPVPEGRVTNKGGSVCRTSPLLHPPPMRVQPGQFYSAPDHTQYGYTEAEVLDFADQPPTSSSYQHDSLPNAGRNTSFHALHASPSSVNTGPYSDPFVPSQTMIHSLFVACDSHKVAFDGVHTGNATESDYATLGRAIMPPEQDGRPRPVIVYVAVAKKTID